MHVLQRAAAAAQVFQPLVVLVVHVQEIALPKLVATEVEVEPHRMLAQVQQTQVLAAAVLVLALVVTIK
jgi:hypothetical protein